jgi:hypothetical protein
VRFFRRQETLNEKLMREAGLASVPAGQLEAEPLDPKPRYEGPSLLGGAPLFDNPAFTGNARPRRWDAVVTAEAPDIAGTKVDFVSLPDGSLLVEEEKGDAALDPLAQAVEVELRPPYRAHGVRQTDQLWAVSAVRIEVGTFEADGDVIELTQTNDGKALRVDGMLVFGSIPELERLGEASAGPAYAVHAERLDGDLWEVRVASL